MFQFQKLSVECGVNTACVKIFTKSEGFDENGLFILLHRRSPEVMLDRGRYWNRSNSPNPLSLPKKVGNPNSIW